MTGLYTARRTCNSHGMFTGIIQIMGRVADLKARPSGVRLVIDPGDWGHTPGRGDSIAVSGCCLTVAEPPDRLLHFDVIQESLDKTILGDLAVGSPVNLEHAASASSFLDGHVVQGHVDGVGTITRVQTGEDYRIRIQPPDHLMPYITPKGSISVDGVSMTVAAIETGQTGIGGGGLRSR